MRNKNSNITGIEIAASSVCLFDLLLIFALRPAWAGIGHATGLPQFAVIMLAVSALLFALSLLLPGRGGRRTSLAVLIISSVIGLLYLYVLKEDLADWPFILREFLFGLALCAAAALILFLLFGGAASLFGKRRGLRIFTAAAAAVVLILVVFDIAPGGIKRGPVVYAVGDEYQIVFTTRARSRAWVEAGGQSFYDTYAGYDRSETRVHKISVPMDVLDQAEDYRIFARTMILRGGYWALQGLLYSQSVPWRPVDESDGIQYYCVSDGHGFCRPSAEAAGYFGDSLDFVIINGDVMSFLERRADLEMPLRIGWEITGGSRPVVFARGNHETKGIVADRLYRYVGTSGEDFFYEFRLGSLWGVVLDLGEDHPDPWYEFYGAARFDDYRRSQTAFLDGLITDAENSFDAPGISHRILVCHIPVNFMNEENPFEKAQREWISRLERMSLDLALYGHRHSLMFLPASMPSEEPLVLSPAFTGREADDRVDGYRLASSFPAVIGGRRTDSERLMSQDDLFGRKMTGTAVEVTDEEIQVRFTDARGEVAAPVDAWTGRPLGGMIKNH